MKGKTKAKARKARKAVAAFRSARNLDAKAVAQCATVGSIGTPRPDKEISILGAGIRKAGKRVGFTRRDKEFLSTYRNPGTGLTTRRTTELSNKLGSRGQEHREWWCIYNIEK
jgi:hypothetical protein